MNQIETIMEWINFKRIKWEGHDRRKASIQIKMKLLSHVCLSVCEFGYF